MVLAGHRGVSQRQVSHGIPGWCRDDQRSGNERSSAQGGESPRISPYGFGAGTRWTDPPRVRRHRAPGERGEIRGFSHTTDLRVVTAVSLPMVARLRLITWSDYRSSPAREARPRSSAPTTSARARSLSSTTRPLATREPWTRAGAISQLRGGRPRRRNAGAGGVQARAGEVVGHSTCGVGERVGFDAVGEGRGCGVISAFQCRRGAPQVDVRCPEPEPSVVAVDVLCGGQWRGPVRPSREVVSPCAAAVSE